MSRLQKILVNSILLTASFGVEAINYKVPEDYLVAKGCKKLSKLSYGCQYSNESTYLISEAGKLGIDITIPDSIEKSWDYLIKQLDLSKLISPSAVPLIYSSVSKAIRENKKSSWPRNTIVICFKGDKLGCSSSVEIKYENLKTIFRFSNVKSSY